MHKLFHFILLILLAIGFLGCAGVGKHTLKHHTTTENYKFINEKYVDIPSGKVWNNLVRELSKSYFMINNIDKESRIINVSFYIENPDKYIDCGFSVVETEIPACNGEKRRKESYKFNLAQPYQYTVGFMSPGCSYGGCPSVSYIVRKPFIEGRINIYVAPKGSGTLVTVNVRYIFNSVLEERYINCAPAGNTLFTGNKTHVNKWTFDSKRSTHIEEVVCKSRGTLEEEILSLVKE